MSVKNNATSGISLNLFSSENILEAIQNSDFRNAPAVYDPVSIFVGAPYGPEGETRYNNAINAILTYQSVVQKKFGKDIIIRNVGTVTDGTVWIDTSKPLDVHTYKNFLAKSITENHNTRLAFSEAILNGIGFEIKQSSSTFRYQARRTLRIGSSRVLVLGVIGTSFEDA